MELYILDTSLKRDSVIDDFVSAIWAERYSSVGDFELVMRSSAEVRRRFQANAFLACNESHRVMVIETIEDKEDGQGEKLLTISGRSLEKVLMDRIAKSSLNGLDVDSKWTITGTPAYIVRYIFDEILVQGRLSPLDILPFYTPGSIFPAETIAEPDNVITIEIEPSTVYKTIKDICDRYELGFRITRNFDNSELMFNVYTGNDRTTGQSVFDPVIFSQKLDNLSNVSELVSIANYKNVAYVFNETESRIVYSAGASNTTNGFDRRVLYVNAADSDVDVSAAATVQDALEIIGQDALTKNRSVSAFDGELDQFSDYKYGVHYHLGDIVEMQGKDGYASNMRVTEQIFVSDNEGDRSYPTLTLNLLITPGSWLAWDNNQVWAEAVGTWSEA